MQKRSLSRISEFQDAVYQHDRMYRRRFPWRETRDPYHIWVSEMMLQQTQADRVVKKYDEFLHTFPTVDTLARASQKHVLKRWQGLGYNRRAMLLHRASKVVSRTYKGLLPSSIEELEALPGIGPYTARAILTFAFNIPVVLIETNIRTAFIHHFFSKTKKKINDREILPYIEVAIDTKKPAYWYGALMDYGAMIKRTRVNPGRRSTHHVKQSSFLGSNRQLRGKILRITLRSKQTLDDLIHECSAFSSKQVEDTVSRLSHEGMIRQQGRYFLV